MREDLTRQSVRARLAALPKPKETEWELELPEEKSDAEIAELAAGRGGQSGIVEDAAVVEKRQAEAERAKRLQQLARESDVIRRALPLPSVVDVPSLMEQVRLESGPASSNGKISDVQSGKAHILREAILSLSRDVARFPNPTPTVSVTDPHPLSIRAKPRPTSTTPLAQIPRSSVPASDRFSESQLSDARRLILAEAGGESGLATASTSFEKYSSLVEISDEPESSDDDDDTRAGQNKLAHTPAIPGLGAYEEDEDEDRLVFLASSFSSVQAQILATATNSNKLEKKLAVRVGGYISRAHTLRQSLLTRSRELADAKLELAMRTDMVHAERAQVLERLERLRDELEYVKRREREAQEVYRARRDELAAGAGANGSPMDMS